MVLFFLCPPETAFFLFRRLEGFQRAGGRGCRSFTPFRFRAFDVVACEEFESKFAVGLGSSRFGIVERYRLSMAGSLGEANITRDRGLEELVVEEALEVFVDLLREVGAVVVHGEENSLE